jgi:hypothetical protein
MAEVVAPTDMRALASIIVDRAYLAAQAGYSFNGARDLYEAFGYKRTLQAQDYRDRYERGGIARRLINTFPNSTWRGGGEVIETEDPEETTAFEAAFFDLAQRLSLWPTFKKTDILASLGRYAVILLGAPGTWDSPLVRINEKELRYLAIHSERSAKVESIELSTESERYAQPVYYTLTHGSALTAASKANSRVHYTRMVHVPAEDELDQPGYGTPRLQAVWNLLDDLEKVCGGGSEAYFTRVDGGKHIKLDPEMPMPTAADLEELNKSLDEYTHGMKRIVKTRGVDIEDLGTAVSNFGSNVASILDLISGTTGVPQRILMGSERGELASTTDQNNYNDRVEDRRNDYAETKVLRPFVDRMIQLGVLPVPTDYEARWPEMANMNETERMQLAKDAATVNKEQGETVITSAEIRDRILGFPPMEEVTGEELDDITVEDDEDDPVVRAAARSRNKQTRLLRLSYKGRQKLRKRKKAVTW